ncbi:ABC transporter related [Petrotoga mobilis SJ95]|jgi:branched-chain amino acid transport system ATP-binding protein|uniref:ABC transporter related n=1 Tax=Petrotoga mobilis (strain DSM 10674 / SJ95) TaxID=403833 RepID=A9BH14_PETMO|nr:MULTISPECIES: ABC transporter ATP-binding protein [Petrotoga]ABX31244.1 ABC transporter related [Petrotoga mobilis SJ95]MBL5982322.1 leucine/isoleucine/valine transporter ATP-binding subunit [Petrotoga sp. 8T1HF07.NaAc.6.1]RLL82374.1 leucine/isoleucine/valine transporter ATP-binding subunit [Petrotoga sp. Shatin.DS.tank11.9.2.9.3]RLL90051.1 leucine/isoleucine/valine transporter ATP-binding subunit [Petrotoga sp. HKA.pet.4.5]
MLEIKNLNLKYGRIQVIWDLTMSIYNNEAVGIFGPNGAGKTTLISSIVGLIKPETGELIFEGNSLIGFKTHEIIRKGISLVPQERELFPFMTVEENLKLGAAYVPNARNRISENLDFVFEIFPILKERIHQLAGTMSGGQQRMLAIGRALMANPKLLILDEPSLGLQPSLVIELFQKLVEIKKSGVSIMLAEQNVKQGLKVIDRGYVLENGKIVMEDVVQNLANSPHIQKSYLGV